MPTQQAILLANQALNPVMRRLTLRPSEPQAFQAGQFLILHLPPDPDAAEGSKPPKGFYSIASSSSKISEIELLVERREGYVSNFVSGLEPGASINIEGPLGKALPLPGEGVLALLCSRAGVAPLRSAILSLRDQGFPLECHLFLGGEPFLEEEWKALANAQAKFHFHPCAEPAAALLASLGVGPGLHAILAGFNAEVLPMAETLIEAGLPKEAVHVEKFG
jgi:NAD(P)H-flavin reductase